MYTDLVQNSLLFNDKSFDSFFPMRIQNLSRRHWTPMRVAEKAARFLAQGTGNVLDIGCGIGKFCLKAAYDHPCTYFYGVDQRPDLIAYAGVAKEHTGLENVHFIHQNVSQLNFDLFDHFYFYNSFYENIDTSFPIDHGVATSVNLYKDYTQYLYRMLECKPSGTRLVTYHSSEHEVPESYEVHDLNYDLSLKMWIKK